MTNKTINGVPRALLQRWLDNEDFFNNLQGQSMSAIDAARKEGDKILDELRALLNAPDPIVEADGIGEPHAFLIQRESCFPNMMGHRSLQFSAPDYPESDNCKVTPLYSADQLAALQSTIAQLKAELSAIELEYSGCMNVKGQLSEILNCADEPRWKWIVSGAQQLKAENERLRGEHGEPVAWRVTGRGNVTITPQYPDWAVGDGAEGLVVQALYPCLDEVRRMNP